MCKIGIFIYFFDFIRLKITHILALSREFDE